MSATAVRTLDRHAIRGVLVYTLVALALGSAIPLLMRALGWSVSGGGGSLLVITAMWIPALARLVATRTVDRNWQSVLPIKRWGRPRLWVVLGPLLTLVGIYLAAYLLGMILGVERGEATWQGASKIALNVAFNLPLLCLIGLFGSIGEELGWRGYMQPRLDEAGIRGSLLIVIAVETLFHMPIILLAGYLASTSAAATIALFFLGKLAATPIWTWGTYRLQSIWVAFWFHTLHNSLSQSIFPKIFGAGDELVLGELGALPVGIYLAVAGALFVGLKLKGQRWNAMMPFCQGEIVGK